MFSSVCIFSLDTACSAQYLPWCFLCHYSSCFILILFLPKPCHFSNRQMYPVLTPPLFQSHHLLGVLNAWGCFYWWVFGVEYLQYCFQPQRAETWDQRATSHRWWDPEKLSSKDKAGKRERWSCLPFTERLVLACHHWNETLWVQRDCKVWASTCTLNPLQKLRWFYGL